MPGTETVKQVNHARFIVAYSSQPSILCFFEMLGFPLSAWPTLRRKSVTAREKEQNQKGSNFFTFDRTIHHGVGDLLAAPVWFQRGRINNVLWRTLCRFGLGGSRECSLSCSVTQPLDSWIHRVFAPLLFHTEWMVFVRPPFILTIPRNLSYPLVASRNSVYGSMCRSQLCQL